MVLTSRAFKEEGMAPETRIIKITREVCVGRDDDAIAGEVRRVPWSVGHILIGDQSAVDATEDELAAFEQAGGKEAFQKANADRMAAQIAAQEAAAAATPRGKAK